VLVNSIYVSNHVTRFAVESEPFALYAPWLLRRRCAAPSRGQPKEHFVMHVSSTKRAIVHIGALATPESPGDRCRHKSKSGRRCERPSDPGNFGFCAIHIAEAQQFREAESRAVASELLGPESSLADPASVNRLLAKLFALVAQGRIPVPTAALLTQIGQLILQTFNGQPPHAEVRLSEGNNAWRQTIVHVLNASHRPASGAPPLTYEDLEREIRTASLEPESLSTTSDFECTEDD
jgi:hypothetical protein